MNMQSHTPEWGNVRLPEGDRRLPIYLLLDTSYSMSGAPIESLKNALELFQQEILSDKSMQDIVRIGVITFSSDANLVSNGLVDFSNFQVPALVGEGVTRLDLAFKVLEESIDRDVIKAIKGQQRGDYKPNVFVLTDGQPTDKHGNPSDQLWKLARDALINRGSGKMKIGVIVSVGCGTSVDDETLLAISTGPAFRMGNDDAAFIKLFQFITQTLTSSIKERKDIASVLKNISLDSDIEQIIP
jgi:uncharacterized protein YegL